MWVYWLINAFFFLYLQSIMSRIEDLPESFVISTRQTMEIGRASCRERVCKRV